MSPLHFYVLVGCVTSNVRRRVVDWRRWWSYWLSGLTFLFDSVSINSLPPSQLTVCYYTGWGGEELDECLQADSCRYFFSHVRRTFLFPLNRKQPGRTEYSYHSTNAFSLNIRENVTTSIAHNFNFITRLLL